MEHSDFRGLRFLDFNSTQISIAEKICKLIVTESEQKAINLIGTKKRETWMTAASLSIHDHGTTLGRPF